MLFGSGRINRRGLHASRCPAVQHVHFSVFCGFCHDSCVSLAVYQNYLTMRGGDAQGGISAVFMYEKAPGSAVWQSRPYRKRDAVTAAPLKSPKFIYDDRSCVRRAVVALFTPEQQSRGSAHSKAFAAQTHPRALLFLFAEQLFCVVVEHILHGGFVQSAGKDLLDLHRRMVERIIRAEHDAVVTDLFVGLTDGS